MAHANPRVEELVIDSMQDMVIETLKTRYAILEGMAREYLNHTGFKVDEVELVETYGAKEITWSFRKKEQADVPTIVEEQANDPTRAS